MSEYDDSLSDRAFADAFTAVYRGWYSPANALWWLANPEQDAPDGTVSPAADRARLQALAYSREGDTGAQQELSRLEEHLVTDRALTLAAVAEARDLIRPLAQDGESNVASPGELSIEKDSLPSIRSRQWVVIGAVVVAVIVLAAGVGIGSRMTPAPLAARATAPTPSNSAAARYPIFDIFATTQKPRDTPTTSISGTALDPASFRLLGDEVGLDVAGDSTMYVARDMAGSPCLIVILGGTNAAGMTCVSERSLTVNGITTYVQDNLYFSSTTWNIDGSPVGTSGALSAYEQTG